MFFYNFLRSLINQGFISFLKWKIKCLYCFDVRAANIHEKIDLYTIIINLLQKIYGIVIYISESVTVGITYLCDPFTLASLKVKPFWLMLTSLIIFRFFSDCIYLQLVKDSDSPFNDSAILKCSLPILLKPARKLCVKREVVVKKKRQYK